MSSSHFASNMLIPSSNYWICHEDPFVDSDAPNEETILSGGKEYRQLLMCEEKLSDAYFSKQESNPIVEKPIKKIQTIVFKKFFLPAEDVKKNPEHSERFFTLPKGKREVSLEADNSSSKRKKIDTIPSSRVPSRPKKKIPNTIMTRSKTQLIKNSEPSVERTKSKKSSRLRDETRSHGRRDRAATGRKTSVLLEDTDWNDLDIGCARTKFWKFRLREPKNPVGMDEATNPIGGELQQLFPEIVPDQYIEWNEGQM